MRNDGKYYRDNKFTDRATMKEDIWNCRFAIFFQNTSLIFSIYVNQAFPYLSIQFYIHDVSARLLPSANIWLM